MDYKVGEQVMIKVSPMNKFMMFRKRGKLRPWYIGHFKVVEQIGPVGTGLLYCQGCQETIRHFIYLYSRG